MKTISKNNQLALADSFLELAQLVGDFRIAHYANLSPQMKIRIRTSHRSLIDCADLLYASSTNYKIDNVEQSIQRLSQSVSSF